jgi:uncharacterized membrane protein
MKRIFSYFPIFLLLAFTNTSAFASLAISTTFNQVELKSTQDFQLHQSLKKQKKPNFIKKVAIKAMSHKITRGLAANSDSKNIAIIAHITLIGWVIALLMHQDNKTSLGGFHLAQMLGLFCTGLCTIVLRFLPFGGWLSLIVVIALLVNWIIGLIHAVNGEEKPMPILGKLYDKMFRKMF